MTVTNVHKDSKALTMTITAELDASVARAADDRGEARWRGQQDRRI